MFTYDDAEHSCTAGRALFIMGQHGMRTGLTKIGFRLVRPGDAERGSHDCRAAQTTWLCDWTIRQESLGDRDEMLPYQSWIR